MALLTAEQILNADDLTHEDVEVREWGGSVRVRTLTAAERDAFETAIYNEGKQDLQNVRARLVSLCIIDENGERLFTNKQVRDLGRKSADAVNRVFDVAQKLNGLSDSDVEDLTKN